MIQFQRFIFSIRFVVPQMSAILLCRKGFTSASELVANTKYSKAKTLNFLQDQSERWVSTLSILHVKTALGDVLGYEVMNSNFWGNSLAVHIGPTLAPEAILFESPCRAHSGT